MILQNLKFAQGCTRGNITDPGSFLLRPRANILPGVLPLSMLDAVHM